MAALVHALAGRARRPLAALLACCAVTQAPAQQAASVQRQDGQSIALAAYAPAGSACQGIAIVSPGAGGSEKGYGYLAGSLAALGYLTAVVAHPESGADAVRHRARVVGLREGLAALITDPLPYRARFQDIAAARDWLRARCAGGIALLVGHSMGAATAMIEAGARNRLGLAGTATFDLYIVLSPQGPGTIFPPGAWSDLRRPILTLTGTRDEELGGGGWQTRTEPYRDMAPGCKWLAVIDGATHMNLAGVGASKATEAHVGRTIAEFIAAHRRGDCPPPPPQAGLAIEAK